nr:AHH domain-containing protein [Novosphingobium sp. FKTRR1]
MEAVRRTELPFRAVNVQGKPGYVADLQRHHILPRAVLGKASLGGMFAAIGPERVGYHDFRRNGLLLPATEQGVLRLGLPLHRGPHGRYNEMVQDRVGQIEAGWQHRRKRCQDAACVEALFRVDLLQKALRRRLLDPRRWAGSPLNSRDPALDFSHLDAMADMLWQGTQAPVGEGVAG